MTNQKVTSDVLSLQTKSSRIGRESVATMTFLSHVDAYFWWGSGQAYSENPDSGNVPAQPHQRMSATANTDMDEKTYGFHILHKSWKTLLGKHI